jgi:hypothetical protein
MTETTYEYPPLRRAIADAVREQQHDEVPAAPAPLPHPTTVDAFHPSGEVVVDVERLITELENGSRNELDGELGVRALLLELRSARQEADRIGRLRDAVCGPYDAALEGCSVRETRIRAVLDDYLKRSVKPDAKGSVKVSIPDAGTAYLTTKNAGGKARVSTTSTRSRRGSRSSPTPRRARNSTTATTATSSSRSTSSGSTRRPRSSCSSSGSSR